MCQGSSGEEGTGEWLFTPPGLAAPSLLPSTHLCGLVHTGAVTLTAPMHTPWEHQVARPQNCDSGPRSPPLYSSAICTYRTFKVTLTMSIDPTGRRGKITEVPSHPVGKEAFFIFIYLFIVQEGEKTGLGNTQPVYASFGPSGMANLRNPFRCGRWWLVGSCLSPENVVYSFTTGKAQLNILVQWISWN